MLEYGSANGSLSLHLAEVLGTFHEESVLVCAYDTIEPEWMEQMAQVQHLPKLSYFAGDFGQLKLSEKYFDIVVINGVVNYLQPEEVINDALRLVTKDGILICYSEEAEKDLDRQVREDLERAEALLSGESLSEAELAGVAACLKEDLRLAVAAGRNDLKIRLIECRHRVLS